MSLADFAATPDGGNQSERESSKTDEFWPHGARMVISVSMQMEAGAQPFERSREPDAQDRPEIFRPSGSQVV